MSPTSPPMAVTTSPSSIDDRALGATFAPQDVGFIDFETRGRLDIKAGAYRYAAEADAIILAFAIGDAPAAIVAVPDFDSGPLVWEQLPTAIHAHHARVLAGEAVWAAWNAGFDRATWNYATLGFPFMKPHHIIDPMVQALASGFPGKLDGAAKFSGSTHKIETGGDLIRLFCVPGANASPRSHPEEWAEFCRYASGDIVAMRDVFCRTRQLALAEWRECWAGERINERGIPIDMPFVAAAAKLADEDRARSRVELAQITAGVVTTVDQVARMTKWLLDRLPPEGRDILLKREEEADEETGEITRPAKFALTRRQVEALLALLDDRHPGKYEAACRVLEIRLYGGSKTPIKFQRMLDQHYDGVLMGQYVFGGAGQTGRYSSKGTQIQNLSRAALKNEFELIDAITAGASYEEVLAMGPEPVARKLALLVRPAFMARPGKVFVWSDWSSIEARIPPWLADYRDDARARLQIFRDVDADPSVPDVYTRTAAVLSNVPIEEVTKPIRQRGKVVELACGFCGGVGALASMAVAYGMYLDPGEARTIVDRWRAENPWAIAFGQDLMDTAHRARRTPDVLFEIGRLGFIFLPEMMGGTLLLRLPSGRFLVYRKLRFEMVDQLDDDGNIVDRKRELTCARGYGRIQLWRGSFVENATQAIAADCLRGTLVRLEPFADWMPVRFHVHDEIVVEVDEARAGEARAVLREAMRRGFDWSEGLPLMSEETTAYAYSKCL
jgi:DNA polymerase bacteriophage-type